MLLSIQNLQSGLAEVKAFKSGVFESTNQYFWRTSELEKRTCWAHYLYESWERPPGIFQDFQHFQWNVVQDPQSWEKPPRNISPGLKPSVLCLVLPLRIALQQLLENINAIPLLARLSQSH